MNGEKTKGNRKRDFSKVVDFASRALSQNEHNNTQSTATSKFDQVNDPSRTIDVNGYLSRQEPGNNAASNIAPNTHHQFNTIQPSGVVKKEKVQVQQQTKKQHLRSLTSHKLTAPPNKPLQIRKEDVQRESSVNKNG